MGLKTSNPTSRLLDRSVSAPSVCSHEGSRAETVNPRAVKSVDSLLEGSITLESKEPPLLPLNLSDHVASANVNASPAEKTGTESCPNPTIPSQNTFEKPVACGSLQKSNTKDNNLGVELPVEAGGSSVSNACKLTKELNVPLLSKHVGRNQMQELHLDLKTCEPGEELSVDGQDEPNSREDLSTVAASPLPARAEQSFDDFLSEGRRAMEGGGEMGASSGEGRKPECVPHKCPGSDTLMEVDVSTEALIAASDPSEKQNVGLTDVVDSECSMMEVQLSKRDSPLPARPPPASDLMQPGSPTFQSAGMSAAAGVSAVSSGGQPSDWTEDPCISLTSALKELHQLLVVSSKQDLKVSQHEDCHQSAAVPEEQAANCEILPEERECTYLDSQDVRLSFPECMGVEASTGKPLFEAGTENVEVREMHRLAVRCGQDALVIQESSDLSSSVFLSPSAASNQLQCGEHSETLSRRSSSGQVLAGEASEQNQPICSSLVQGQVASQSTLSSSAEGTGMPDASNTDAQRPLDAERAEPSSPLPAGSPDPALAPQPPVFPPAAMNQIVQAGFTPQEASEALEHAGGNADLALLILLAKNIVVPT